MNGSADAALSDVVHSRTEDAALSPWALNRAPAGECGGPRSVFGLPLLLAVVVLIELRRVRVAQRTQTPADEDGDGEVVAAEYLLVWTPSGDAGPGAVAVEVSLSPPSAGSGRPVCGWSRNAMAVSYGGCGWWTVTAVGSTGLVAQQVVDLLGGAVGPHFA